jgi:DNA-binding transcriptional LysR family regulator
VEVRKGAVGRKPRTWFRLTAEGRQALAGHLAWLAQLEEAVSASTQDAQQARPIPGDHDQPRHVLPPLLGST